MTIPHLSPFVINELQENPEAAWRWFSEQFMARQRAQNRDHLLVRVAARFDLSEVERASAAYRMHEAGQRGQAATHTVGQLVRGWVVKYLYGWSYRETVRQMRTDLVVRDFVGYRLDQVPMSYGTLRNFERWVEAQGEDRRLFTQTLQQIDADFPAERRATQAGDSYAMESRAAAQSKTELVRGASARVMARLQPVAPLLHTHLLEHFDWDALLGTAEERRESLLPQAERVAREERTAQAGHALHRQVSLAVRPLLRGSSVEVQALEKWLGHLEKILHDEFLFELDGAGQARKATRREKHAKGAFAMGSTVDPEATFRKHGKQHDLGYNVQVAATPNFIREIFAVTGATPDGSGVADLIANQRKHLGVVPPKLLYDAAAGYPKYFAEVERASGGETQLVAPLVKNGRNPDRFGPADFTLGENGELICPAGQVSTKMYRASGADGWQYRFTAEQCRGCPLLAQCHTAPDEPLQKRTVTISHYASYQREALAYTKTPEFQEEFKGRAHIERIIALLTRYNGGRQAQGYGLRRADFQARMAATAYNLKRWHKMTLDEEKAARQRARQRREENYDPSDG